jgi:hypothetical protein
MSQPGRSAVTLYRDLDIKDAVRSVRMLELHPLPDNHQENPYLSGTLRVVSLLDIIGPKGIKYTALSYVWSEEDASEPNNSIDCNGVDIAITKNCRDALIRIARLSGKVDIWVDSICINQSDREECSRQVTLMRDIYSEADTAYVWLHFDSERYPPFYFPPLSNPPRTYPPTRTMDFVIHNYSSSSWMLDQFDASGEMKVLLGNKWFRRGWTFQEFLLAPDILILTSVGQLRWHDLRYFIKNAETRLKAHQEAHVAFPLAVYEFVSLARVYDMVALRRRRVVRQSTPVSNTLLIGLYACYVVSHMMDIHLDVYHRHRGSYRSRALISTSGMLFAQSYHYLYAEWLLRFLYILGELTLLISAGDGLLQSIRLLNRISRHPRHPHLEDYMILVIYWIFVLAVTIILSTTKVWRMGNDALRLFLACDSYPGGKCATFIYILPRIDHEHLAECNGIMQALRAREVTHAKDKAYAMYGVLQVLGVQLTPPDYKKHQEEVFEDLFVDLLTWRPEMLALLADAGGLLGRRPETGMPTWVPYWDGPPQSICIPEVLLYQTRAYDALSAMRRCGFPFWQLAGKVLSVWGRPVDTVAYILVLPDVSSPETIEPHKQQIFEWVSELQRRRDFGPFEKVFRFSTCFEVFRALMAKEVGILDAKQCENGKLMLFITQNGRFGTGSLNIHVGDVVHFVSGVPVPLCLREVGSKKQYEVIGPATINDDGLYEIWQGKLNRIELV